MKKSYILIVLTAALLTGCDIKGWFEGLFRDTTQEVIAVLDRGINQLEVTSADWQDIMNEVINDLPDEVQSTITNEVTNLLNRGIAAAGAEIRCNVDFFRNRMKQGLQRIKARFLDREIPPLEPQLCKVVPLAVDMSLDPNRRNKIEFYGYDFDKTVINVKHVENNGQNDISHYLDKPTHYHMTLNLGSSGVSLNENSRRLVLRWNDRVISTIGVIQPEPEICETKFKNDAPSDTEVMPAHAAMPGKSRGDREFDGNGPFMYCRVKLSNLGNRINARIFVKAEETESDWTYGRTAKSVTIYNADPGYEIESIVDPGDFAEHSYTDNDHSTDVFAGHGPVQKFTFMGDGDGNDIGVHTSVKIQFKPIRVRLKETGDCVSSATVKSLDISESISPELKTKMEIMNSSMDFISPEELAPLSGDEVTPDD